MMIGYIDSIETMGLVDGPGVRFVVFLKGCKLRCLFCHNPETWTKDNATQITSDELLNKIKTTHEDCEIDFSQENCIQILEYTTSGRVKSIKFGNKEIAGTEARTLLGLKSTNFTVSKDGENIIFSVTGYGHGVGMSQTGADALAKSGLDYQGIIKHYYTDVEIIEVNSL